MSRSVPLQAATVTPITASATVVTLFSAAGTSRGRRLVFNDASTALYIKFGPTASLTDFTVKVAIGGYYEMPLPTYAGQVTGIWDTGPTGNARLTEY